MGLHRPRPLRLLRPWLRPRGPGGVTRGRHFLLGADLRRPARDGGLRSRWTPLARDRAGPRASTAHLHDRSRRRRLERPAASPGNVAPHRRAHGTGHLLCQRHYRLGPLRATCGTGYYPLHHKLPGNQMRGPDGVNTDAWQENADPSYLEKPTVSELWDEATGNEAVIGTLSYEGWHLGMIGHGAQREGADRDIAVLWEQDENEWWINEDFYELPDYLEEADLGRLESYEEGLDGRDGIEDGRWLGHTLEELRDPELAWRPGTPAFVRFNGDAAVDIIRREGLGEDDVSDLFWLELKMPDYAGHAWNMLSPEESDVIREIDRQIARIKSVLDEQVGEGRYVLGLSADHGQEPLPEHFGGWRISTQELKRDVEERFGDGLIEKITTVDFFVDREVVSRRGVNLSDVARFLGTYTVGDNIPEGAAGASSVPEERLDDVLFAGAFSTEYLQSLTSERIASFGEGAYEESDLLIGETRSRWE